MSRSKQWGLCIMANAGSLCLLFLLVAVAVYRHAPEDKEPISRIYENACLLGVKDGKLQLLHEDGVETFALAEGKYEVLEQTIQRGAIADVTVADGKIVGLVLKNQRVQATEWTYTGDGVMLGDRSVYVLSEGFLAYDEERGRLLTKEQLYAYENVVFYLNDGCVCAAIGNTLSVPNIRVLITGGVGTGERECVTITANAEFSAKKADGTEKMYAAGEKLSVQAAELADGEYITLSGGGGFLLDGCEELGVSYAGSMEIQKHSDGLYLVNELPLEEYLYGVLPGEIPGSYESEAQKAQAVCARTYAFSALSSYRYPELRAHLDDTTNAQVYNNASPTKEAIRAVDETCGYILTDDKGVAATYYYSTSYGVGAAVEEIWSDSGEAYLCTKLHSDLSDASEVVKSLVKDNETDELICGVDLSSEEAFRAFLEEGRVRMRLSSITIEETIRTYDSDYAWYRWSMACSAEEFSRQVEVNLAGLSSSLRDKVRFTEGEELGEIQAVDVTKRGKSGVVMEITVTGSKGTLVAEKQSAIRALFAPGEQTVVREDGKEVKSMSLLPSGYFCVEITKDTVEFSGGGYGHGVGMSQNGANAMAGEGYRYDEILAHYYGGTKQECIYGS